MALLTGQVPPLDASSAFSADVAGAATFAQLARQQARRSGVLKGKPTWEAREVLAARVRSAANRSRGFRDWGHLLLTGLLVRPEQLRPDDLLWWRRFTGAPERDWASVRTEEALGEVAYAAEIVGGWLWALAHPGEADIVPDSFDPLSVPVGADLF